MSTSSLQSAVQGMPVATTPSQISQKNATKSLCSDQSHMLLKQQLFQTTHQLQLLKIHNENLLSQIAQLKQKQQQLKHLNQVILQNLNNKHQQGNNEINLKIQGEFLNNRIKQLEQELDNYRNGVCDSVDRRVKKIVGQFTQQQEIQAQKRSHLQEQNQSQRRKSKVGLSPTNNNIKQRQNQYYETHQHKYYNIQYNNYINGNRSSPNTQQSPQSNLSENSISPPYTVSFSKTNCQKCNKLQQIIADQTEYISTLQDKIKHFIHINSIGKGSQSQLSNNSSDSQQQLNSNNSNAIPSSPSSQQLIEQWKLKYLQLLKLYENLKQQHQILQSEPSTPNDNPKPYTYQNHNHYYQQKSPNNYHHNQPKDEQHYVVAQLSPLAAGGFKKKQLFPQKNNQFNKQANNNNCQSRFYKEERDNRSTQMLQQITNLVNGLGKNNKTPKHQQQKSIYCYQKMPDKKSRISQISNHSRVSMTSNNKLDGSAFTIKQGVNRYNTNNPFF